MTTRVSKKFLFRLKINDLPQYKLAQKADVDPNTLSKLIRGIEQVKPNDQRILRIATVLGLSEAEAFETSTEVVEEAS